MAVALSYNFMARGMTKKSIRLRNGADIRFLNQRGKPSVSNFFAFTSLGKKWSHFSLPFKRANSGNIYLWL